MLQWNNSTSHCQAMFEWRTYHSEMRGDNGNPHVKLGLMTTPCASQFLNSSMVGSNSNPSAKHTDTLYSEPNQACHIAKFCPILYASSSPSSLFHVHNYYIIIDHNVKLSLSMSPCHHNEISLGRAYTKP